MEIINNPTQTEIKKADKALMDGQLVAFPTETVYGLGADATNEKAVSRVYSVKARPTDHPLIVHISSINQLGNWAVDIPEYAIKIAEEFWPGPMTLILKRSKFAKDFITGGQENVGVRVPSHPVALALLSEFEKLGGLGVAAPSANRFGAVSPTTAEAVVEEIGLECNSDELLLDGGASSIGIESTIIDCTRAKISILRPGAITLSMIEEVAKIKVCAKTSSNSRKFSGNFKSHYAPKASIILSAAALPGDGFLALSDVETPAGVVRLAAPINSYDYAACLYYAFRLADLKALTRIIVIPPSGEGIETAILDRIKKASKK